MLIPRSYSFHYIRLLLLLLKLVKTTYFYLLKELLCYSILFPFQKDKHDIVSMIVQIQEEIVDTANSRRDLRVTGKLT